MVEIKLLDHRVKFFSNQFCQISETRKELSNNNAVSFLISS